ncbi:MAG: hypothetical protein IIZ83_06955 [Oscillospiraceae bacterium]|nr:hypothetical protein [Oscillospiraceae bacterium]
MADRMKESTPFSPEPGKIYENEGGGVFRCESLSGGNMFDAWMVNVRSGWYFLARGVRLYPDGRIDWNYSTGGRFTTPQEWPALRQA